MTSKIRIKVGPVEVEYEGDEAFLKKDLAELLASVSKLHRESGIALAPEPPQAPKSNPPVKDKSTVGTTGTLAAKLKSSSGGELALAAAARLSIVDQKGSFTRDELLKEMKTANSYYKKTYSGNLSNYLTGLVKSGKFIETASDTYALSAPAKSDLEARLAS